MTADRTAIERTILALCAARGPERSICPSEVARALAGDDEKVWRLLMHPVREEALRLARAGRVEILRKGKTQDPNAGIRGVIRLRIAGGVSTRGEQRPGARPAGRERQRYRSPAS
jgi:hypothetical protein